MLCRGFLHKLYYLIAINLGMCSVRRLKSGEMRELLSTHCGPSRTWPAALWLTIRSVIAMTGNSAQATWRMYLPSQVVPDPLITIVMYGRALETTIPSLLIHLVQDRISSEAVPMF